MRNIIEIHLLDLVLENLIHLFKTSVKVVNLRNLFIKIVHLICDLDKLSICRINPLDLVLFKLTFQFYDLFVCCRELKLARNRLFEILLRFLQFYQLCLKHVQPVSCIAAHVSKGLNQNLHFFS